MIQPVKTPYAILESYGVDVRFARPGYGLVAEDWAPETVHVHILENLRIVHIQHPASVEVNFVFKDFYLAWRCLCLLVLSSHSYDPLCTVYFGDSKVEMRDFLSNIADEEYLYTVAYGRALAYALSAKHKEAFLTFRVCWSESSAGKNAARVNLQKLIYPITPYYDDAHYADREIERRRKVESGDLPEAAPCPRLSL